MTHAHAAKRAAGQWSAVLRRDPWAMCMLAVTLLAVPLVFVRDPARWAGYPPCLFHAATGLHCPGCGSLRGLHQLLHGNLLGALRLNALMVVCAPFLGGALLHRWIRLARPVRWPALRRPRYLGWMLVAAMVAFTVLRNVPTYPLSLLAPASVMP